MCAALRCAVLYARRPRKYYHLQDNSTLFDCTMVMCVQCPLHTCCKSALCVCQRLHMSYHYIIVTVVNRCGYVNSNFGQLCVLWSLWGYSNELGRNKLSSPIIVDMRDGQLIWIHFTHNMYVRHVYIAFGCHMQFNRHVDQFWIYSNFESHRT